MNAVSPSDPAIAAASDTGTTGPGADGGEEHMPPVRMRVNVCAPGRTSARSRVGSGDARVLATGREPPRRAWRRRATRCCGRRLQAAGDDDDAQARTGKAQPGLAAAGLWRHGAALPGQWSGRSGSGSMTPGSGLSAVHDWLGLGLSADRDVLVLMFHQPWVIDRRLLTSPAVVGALINAAGLCRRAGLRERRRCRPRSVIADGDLEEVTDIVPRSRRCLGSRRLAVLLGVEAGEAQISKCWWS